MHAAPRPAAGADLTDEEFRRFSAWIRSVAGISLGDMKKALVMTRLAPRLRHYALASYGDYFALLMEPARAAERQMAVDLLTTNETHFFREARHFEFLGEQAAARRGGGRPFRVWSAACSSGEEAYSIAMTLAERLGDAAWEVLASDVSLRVLERARTGHYDLARGRSVPPALLARYCLRGIAGQAGTFLVGEKLRARVQFAQINLNATLPALGRFDVVFLRNAMIYFDLETKREVTARVLRHLEPRGFLLVGHAESLHDIGAGLDMVRPSIYRRRDE